MMKAKLWRADPKQDSICLGKIKVSKGPMKNKIQSVNELKLPMSTGKEGHISRDFKKISNRCKYTTVRTLST